MSNWWKVTRNGQSLYWDHAEHETESNYFGVHDVARGALQVSRLPTGVILDRIGDKPMNKNLIPTGGKAYGYTLYMEGAL
jgi:hypothetical protein